MTAGDDGQPYLILIPAFAPCSLGKSFSMARPALLFLEAAVGTLDPEASRREHRAASLQGLAGLWHVPALVPGHLAFLQFT